MKRIGIFTLVVMLASTIWADCRPGYLTATATKSEVQKLIDEEEWAADVFRKLKVRTDKYADCGAEWLTSRLQMYWNSHATEVFVDGEYFDHVGGDAAPAPTVMLSGARSHATNYKRPKLEELEPYQEDERGMYLANKSHEDAPKEWVSIDKTGNIIQSINQEIVGIARDAAFLWWLTDEDKYADLALSVFDTYMTGIYHRNVPIDINHGHQQTIIGLTTFEVIHEDALNALVPLYDFLYDKLVVSKPDKIAIYAAAFKKWAENVIANGVPHNNWDLIQAAFILRIAMILDSDDSYADGKGREHYVDYVLNQSSVRQWSLKHLADYGFDAETGIWSECPGYSQVVIGDFAELISVFDRNLGIDLVEQMPVLIEAVRADAQYLFPDKMTMGYGDTHPSQLSPDIFRRLVANAQAHGKKDQEREFTAMLKTLFPDASEKKNRPIAVTSFFADKPLQLDETVSPNRIDDYVTPTFYAKNASWLVQRNGMDEKHSLMIAQNGSLGNHNHANGISMELYGKGYRLAPDAGIGLTLYSGLDYAEYYSQFPAHNTVCVDGISSYPVMMSNHAFTVDSCYPVPRQKVDYQPVTYSDISFVEPETQSLQRRVMSIITTGETTGYYVDIFRSKRQDGNDKMHDYFYHNLGQTMSLAASDGSDLDLQPTEELCFAGGYLSAYSYIYDKKCAETDNDIQARFTIDMPDGDDISMNMWMKGYSDRTVFSALSPMTEGLSRLKGMPYDVKKQPTLTFVARQQGEAWTRPFVAIYEPVSVNEPGTVESVSFPEVVCEGSGNCVAIEVVHKSGSRDLILSCDNPDTVMRCGDVRIKASYAVYRDKILIFAQK